MGFHHVFFFYACLVSGLGGLFFGWICTILYVLGVQLRSLQAFGCKQIVEFVFIVTLV